MNMQVTAFPDVEFLNDPENGNEDNQDPMVVIASAEERARAEQKRHSQKSFSGSDRHYATHLHQEADQLFLRYFDGRKDIWKMSPGSSHKVAARLTRAQIMQRQLSSQAEASLKSLTSFFNAGDFKSTLNIGQELISLASGVQNPHRYLVEAHHYLALIHVSAKRHDRAIKNVSQMIYTAKASGNRALFTKSLVTLGVVHLSFGHLEAVCRAWEWLFPELEDSVPQAWLSHEIGRCHFDSGRYSKSLKLALQSQEIAEQANSKKWFMHAKLLSGQSLLKLGRFGEAFETLKAAAEIFRGEGDSTFGYIQDLVDQVSKVLRRMLKSGEKGTSFKENSDNISDTKSSSTECEIWKSVDETLPDKCDDSGSSRTYVLKKDFDSEATRTTNANSTYTVRNPVVVGTFKSLDISEMGDSQIRNILTEPSVIANRLNNLKVPSILEKESESVLRTLSGIGGSQVSKARAEEDILSPSVELLSKDLDERISLNASRKLRDGRSKSPKKCIEVDTDWRLDFVRSRKDEDLVDATESIQSGRTYGFFTKHALYRHSLPSSPRKENTTEKLPKTFEGFRSSPDPF
ncbi:uncharacterized protein LOC117173494 isoform X2 [Belonocnema kinseyi]|uniref:uncharacterized protein LOC117173494 isoform X2 n=1 Tax=Belonocnema kinseyi TaxID=2817044 RepID=UPI00143D47DD|nr:uncharacterized protein LOC117173494 isoform X2 [Belonocnema kinseyi]